MAQSHRWTSKEEDLVRKSLKMDPAKLAQKLGVKPAELARKVKNMGLVKKSAPPVKKATAAKAKPVKKPAPAKAKTSSKQKTAKPVKAAKKKTPEKKAAVKAKAKPIKKESKKAAKAANYPLPKPEPLPKLQEPRLNIRCRSCYLIDGYTREEKTCHYCGFQIFEIDTK